MWLPRNGTVKDALLNAFYTLSSFPATRSEDRMKETKRCDGKKHIKQHSITNGGKMG
jgi:hypothetical protein